MLASRGSRAHIAIVIARLNAIPIHKALTSFRVEAIVFATITPKWLTVRIFAKRVAHTQSTLCKCGEKL
jgi:hypothetical protein